MRESAPQHPVTKYQDKLAKIETTEAHSVLLHVPHTQFMQVVESFGRDHKEVERLLFECMPTLGTYAQASIQRVFSCFQEFHFGQNQWIFKESRQPEYLHLIAEGEVKLIASSNPYNKSNSNHKAEHPPAK